MLLLLLLFDDDDGEEEAFEGSKKRPTNAKKAQIVERKITMKIMVGDDNTDNIIVSDIL